MEASSTYSDKLRDPRWQKLRLRVFERDEFKCLCCGSDDRTLNVHHLIYSKGEPWDAPIETLETLCDPCHKFREEFNELGRLAIDSNKPVARTTVPTLFCYSFMRFVCAEMHEKTRKCDPLILAGKFATFWRYTGPEKLGQVNNGDQPKADAIAEERS